jgi:hypothetical protein
MYVNEAELSNELLRLVSSALKPSDSPILVGFSLYTEFKWISGYCPSLTSLFVGWVDLQDTVAENSGTVDPGLLHTLNAMKIVERPPGSNPPNRHRASNDAVRCLAVLAGLICLDSFAVPTKIYKPVKLALLSKLPAPIRKYPFTAPVTTADGGIIPPEYNSPKSLYELFKRFQPTVLL